MTKKPASASATWGGAQTGAASAALAAISRHIGIARQTRKYRVRWRQRKMAISQPRIRRVPGVLAASFVASRGTLSRVCRTLDIAICVLFACRCGRRGVAAFLGVVAGAQQAANRGRHSRGHRAINGWRHDQQTGHGNIWRIDSIAT
jgi:hypothetical protein